MWWVYLLTIIILIVGWNLIFRYLTYRSLEKEIRGKSWKDVPLDDYIKQCYHFISERYPMLRHCWAKRFWRSFFYRNLWNLKGKSLPCHMYNVLFNYCMRLRLPKKDIRLKYIADFDQLVFVHYYSQLRINGKWINVDVWGKHRGVPLGETINSPGWKR
ncbi:MAG: hypothetical protein WCV90_05470 [Candidatus Woesearchaeota archaeon]|jgi:hypothetical protein